MKSIEQNLSAYKAGQVGQAGQRAPLGSVSVAAAGLGCFRGRAFGHDSATLSGAAAGLGLGSVGHGRRE